MKSFAQKSRLLIPASILAFGTLTSAVVHAQEDALNIGAVPTGTGWFFGISEGARVISANTPYEITVRETGGTRENAIRLGRDELDLAFTEALVGYEQYNGIGRFEDTPNENVRLVYWIAPSTMHWAVRQDAEISNFEELAGERFNPSSIGGGGEYITELVFDILGVEPDFQRMRIDDAAEGVIDGRLVGFSYNGIPPIPAFTEVHSSRPLQLLSLSEEQIETVTAELPFLSPSIIPADTYRGMDEATSLGIYMGVSANSTLDNDIVYDITQAYWENHDQVSASFAPAKGMTPQDVIDNATFPIHAGALRYYQELGLEIPEDVIPPEAR
ncbi:TAXI family TRAP transporter solute-binding subunit [Vreelandella maris]|uniref:TAXI family TRAP transporter solute-binding subunit n=1 Tax=Vreelandella maris TaxID=2729617 RepID=A0A7Y6V795_9GAMM|nr:TAXI family TRAP transporter solute-binding subunit [Halomonas maris]NVF12657.1 TAXI family TRAP transporter solute-binding subunit [Halomonas maris]|tara:strand:- start:2204 stop:3190 length:987 start_codon:yes stop_codon:yes gene_type:complete